MLDFVSGQSAQQRRTLLLSGALTKAPVELDAELFDLSCRGQKVHRIQPFAHRSNSNEPL
jgi:hypothetical protein